MNVGSKKLTPSRRVLWPVLAVFAALTLSSCGGETFAEQAEPSKILQSSDGTAADDSEAEAADSSSEVDAAETAAKNDAWCAAIDTFINVKRPNQPDDLVRSMPFLLQTIANTTPGDAPDDVKDFFAAYATAKGADVKAVDTGEDQTQVLETSQAAIAESEDVTVGFVAQTCPDTDSEALKA